MLKKQKPKTLVFKDPLVKYIGGKYYKYFDGEKH